jgi:hypothetical protein
MMIGLLVAGIAAILAGVLAIAYGFLLELSFGNTLILAGAFGMCSGIIVLAQTLIVHELRNLARKLSPRMAAPEGRPRPLGTEDGFAPTRDPGPMREQPESSPIPAASGLLWRDEGTSRDRMRQEPADVPDLAPPPEVVEPAPQPPRRRNLLFSSTVRKDRERPPQLPDADPAVADQQNLPEADDAPPSFQDSFPRTDRQRPSEMMAQRRAARAALAEGRAGAARPERPAPPPLPREEPPAHSEVTVIKSGVVDGMAYSLYSDGSIEAEMPEGMMRFASIDELRAHLDRRL